jgi:hypothetical protein
MDIEHKVMSAIDKQLERLPYITASVEVVMADKTLSCEYTKNKPIKGFSDK